MRQVDGVLHDVDLALQRRLDIDRGVGDDERLVVGRHVHHEAVADAAGGAQPALAPHDGAHQLVGVQAALHQRLGLALQHQFHGLRGRGVAVRRVDDRGCRRGRCRPAPRPRGCGACGPTRIGMDQAQPRRPDGAFERRAVARVDDRGGRRRQALAGVEQVLVLGVVAHGCGTAEWQEDRSRIRYVALQQNYRCWSMSPVCRMSRCRAGRPLRHPMRPRSR